MTAKKRASGARKAVTGELVRLGADGVPNRAPKLATGEFAAPVAAMGDEFVEEVDGASDITERAAVPTSFDDESFEGGAGGPPGDAAHGKAGVPASRDRKSTLVSPIPAMLAASMSTLVESEAQSPSEARDPAAPLHENGEVTRPIGDSDKQRFVEDSESGYTVELLDDANAAARQRAAALIDSAREQLDRGDLIAAAVAAEEALAEGERAPPPGISEVIEPARPLFERIFAACVGPLTAVPLLVDADEEAAAQRLGKGARRLLTRVNGRRTMEQIFDGAGMSTVDGLRLMALLLRSGAVRAGV
jgi:hypothetical protein